MTTKAEILAQVRHPPTVPLPQPPPLLRSLTSPHSPILTSPSSEALMKDRQRGSEPALRKRHSMYIRPPDRSPSPVPDLPPHRPPRNPARISGGFAESQSPRNSKPKLASRPSTATSTKSEISPAQFAARFEPSRTRSGAPSVKSKASSTGFGMTGPVEDVLPWELRPAPVELPSPKLLSANQIVLKRPSAPPPQSLHPTKPTGLVEDVTPWELEPVSASSIAETMPPPPPSPSSPFAPSQSHPASLLSAPSNGSSHRLSTATGPISEVAPWELEETIPPRKEISSTLRQRNSLSLSKAEVEEVMPWELQPIPPVPSIAAGSKPTSKSGIQSNRSSISSSKNVPDLALLRRRRSGGNRAPSKSRSNTQQEAGKQPTPPSQQYIHEIEVVTPTTAKSITSIAMSSDCNRPNGSTSPTAPDAKGKDAKRRQSNPNFSTADRTILEELKRNIHARNAQFTLKGVGTHYTNGTISSGKKHHPYMRQDVPYPRCYDRVVLDLDIWEGLFCQDISDSLTFNVFEKAPVKVLDIGCGAGTWIVDCARQWKDTHFVGLDIVPLHPDLQQVGSSDLASRITWVQGNFLDGLPFPNEEFDYVHVKRISLGVPEDKWDTLFDEISRIMKPGAALEVIEEDLFFPGKLVQRDEGAADMPSLMSRSGSMASLNGRCEVPPPIPEGEAGNEQQVVDLPVQDTDLSTPKPGAKFTVIPPLSPPGNGAPDLGPGVLNGFSTSPPGSPKQSTTHVPPHSRSANRPKLHVKASFGSSGHARGSTIPPKHSTNNLAESTVSLLSSLSPQHNTQAEPEKADAFYRRRRSSSNLTTGRESTNSNQASAAPPVPPIPPQPQSPPTKVPSLPPITAVPNPRDHSLLKYIYEEMLASRFINLSPLSLLSNSLEYHFKDVRSHPPLLFSFPPLYPTPLGAADEDYDDHASLYPDHEEEDNSTSPVQSVASQKSLTDGVLPESERFLSMHGLLHHASPFITLDVTKAYSFPPSGNSPFSSQLKGKNGLPNKKSRLPNKTLNIDLRTLHLHLALRAQEILGCSESMWEWVHETQLVSAAKAHSSNHQRGGRGKNSFEVVRPNPQGTLPTTPEQAHRAAVLDLTRVDFNQLLLNFEMDMLEQASVNVALKNAFQWNTIETERSANRTLFEKKLTAYNEHMEKNESETRHASPVSPKRPLDVPTAAPSQQGTGSLPSVAGNRSNSNVLTPGGPTAGNPPSSEDNTSPSADPLPFQRLSRSVRVFVAWKASNKI